jgi:outer membrane protein
MKIRMMKKKVNNFKKTQMKNYCAIVVFLFGCLSVFAQNKKWTLQDCVNYALENNITIKQNENTLLVNQQEILQARGNFLPAASANVSHNLSLGNRELFPGQFVDRTDNSTSINIGVNQTIFDGFRLTNLYKQSQLQLETNQLELNRIKDDVSLNVVNTYLNALFNKERLEIANAQFEFSKKQLEQVKNLVDAGVQPKVNMYDAEATLSRDDQQVVLAENNYDLALLSLSQLLQVPYKGFDIEIIDIGNPSVALLYNNIDPILNFAYENRYEIKVAEKNIENAELRTEISKSGFYPTVTASYGYGSNVFFSSLFDTEASFLDQLDQQKGQRFGVNVSIPIFSRFQNKTAVARSKIQEDNSKLNLDQAKLNLESNIQRAFTDAKAAFKAFDAAKKSLAAQQLAFSNTQERYNIGAMNTFELEQARVQLINAQSSLINAKYDFVFKTKVLDFYMGKSLTN